MGDVVFKWIKRFKSRTSSPPTERVKILKEKVLDVVEPSNIIGLWCWENGEVRLKYYPELQYRTASASCGYIMYNLSYKEMKWLSARMKEIIDAKRKQWLLTS